MISNKKLITLVGLYGCIIVFLAIMAKYNVKEEINKISTISADSQNSPTVQRDPSFNDVNQNSGTKVEIKPAVENVRTITAKSYLVGDVNTGKIYFEKNSNVYMPVASMSKLITAFVATDLFATSTTISITEQAILAPPDSSNMVVGDRFSLSEILYPLLLNSSNVAAESISESSDRFSFLESMNSYAWEVGMPTSLFADPSGVSPGNGASARDVFGLAKYLFNFRKDILDLTRNSNYNLATTTEHGSYEFVSTHPFVNDPRFIGGKTGRTPEAGETMMTIMKIKDKNIAFIVLGSQFGNREGDTRLLFEKFEDNN